MVGVKIQNGLRVVWLSLSLSMSMYVFFFKNPVVLATYPYLSSHEVSMKIDLVVFDDNPPTVLPPLLDHPN